MTKKQQATTTTDPQQLTLDLETSELAAERERLQARAR